METVTLKSETARANFLLQITQWVNEKYPSATLKQERVEEDAVSKTFSLSKLSQLFVQVTSSETEEDWAYVEIKDGFASHFYFDIKNPAGDLWVLLQTLGPTAAPTLLLQGSLLECLDKAFEQVQELPKQFYSKAALSTVERPW